MRKKPSRPNDWAADDIRFCRTFGCVFFLLDGIPLLLAFDLERTDRRRIILKLCKREVPNFSLVYKSDRKTGHSSLSLSPSPVLVYPLPAWSSVSLLVHLCAILDGGRSHLQQLASTQEWARANKCDYYIIHTYNTYGYKIVLKDGGAASFRRTRLLIEKRSRMVTNFLLLPLLLLSLVTEIITSHDGHGTAGIGISRDDFPPGFVFGAGTSAYQVPLVFLPSIIFIPLFL